MPGSGGMPPAPPGYVPPGLPDVAAGSTNIFRGRLVIVFGPSGAVTGVFVYAAGTTPALGNPPIFWATSSSVDPFGNVLPSTVGVAGTGTFRAGNTIVTPAGLFTYQSATTPGLGNPPIFWATTGTADPFGNALPSTVGVAGTGTFESGNTIIVPTGIYVYSSTPGAGNLSVSIASAAGTDPFGTSVPAGAYMQQLTLPNGAAPPAFTGASVLYSGSLGRLRYLSPAGADMIIDRSVVNIGNFTMNTQTLPQVMSGALNYLANEAVTGSEYEIEIDGTFTSPNTASATFTFDLFIDAGTFGIGSAVTVGTVVVSTAVTYAYTVKFRMYVVSPGIAANISITCVGSVTRKGVNAGNTSTFTTLNNTVVSGTFDSTSNHTLAIYCNWGSTTGTGHSAITYRTRLVRRN